MRLYAKNVVLEDELTYDEQTSDVSIGCSIDGESNLILFTDPTPGLSNQTTDIHETSSKIITYYPNPVIGNSVRLSEKCNFKMINNTGQILLEKKFSDMIDISNYSAGLYLVLIDSGQTIKLIVK